MNSDYKVLIFSKQNDFLNKLTKDPKMLYGFTLSSQKATSLKMLEFLLTEWSPHFCFIEVDADLEQAMQIINLTDKKRCCGVFSFSEIKTKDFEKASYLLGVDHFIPTPVEKYLLTYKLKNLAHRLFGEKTQSGLKIPIQTHLGSITILPNENIVKVNQQCVKVTPTQFKLLNTFANNHEKLLSRQCLKEIVWDNQNISLRSIDAQISKLKSVIPQLNDYLINIYGKGYVVSSNQKRSAA